MAFDPGPGRTKSIRADSDRERPGACQRAAQWLASIACQLILMPASGAPRPKATAFIPSPGGSTLSLIVTWRSGRWKACDAVTIVHRC